MAVHPSGSLTQSTINAGAPVVETTVNPVTSIVQAFHPHPGLVRPDRTAKQADQQYEYCDLDAVPKLPCMNVHSLCFSPNSSASAPYNGTPARWLTIGASQFCIMCNWLTES
jgi:hypothetical protein